MSKTIKFECTRRNVSPKEFYTYCKKQAAKKNIGLEMWISFNDFTNPVETTSIKKDNEINIIKPYKTQFYLKNDYNFIIEFNFDDDKKGVGYCYIEIIEEEKEETKLVETVEENKEETETQKQEEETIEINEAIEIEGVTVRVYNPALTMQTVKTIINDLISNINLNKIKVDYIHILKNNKGIIKENTGQQILMNYFTYNEEGLKDYYETKVYKDYQKLII